MTNQLQKTDTREKTLEFIPKGSQDKVALTINLTQKLLCSPTKTGKLCSDRDAMRYMMMCQAMRLNPFEQDAFLVGYDGKDGPEFSIITAHKAFLKRAELDPGFDGMESGVTVQHEDGRLEDVDGDFFAEGRLVAGWARVHHKQRKIPTYRRVALSRFNKNNKFWNDDPAGMICKCAEADALRSTFPTMLGGLYLRQEMESGAAIDVPSSVASFDAAAAQLPESFDKPADPDSNPELEPAKPEPAQGLNISPAKKKSPGRPRKGQGNVSVKGTEAHTTEETPQETLANLVTGAGYSFDEFVNAAKIEGWPGIADEQKPIPDWASLDPVKAKMLAHSFTHLLEGLKQHAGEKGGNQ